MKNFGKTKLIAERNTNRMSMKILDLGIFDPKSEYNKLQIVIYQRDKNNKALKTVKAFVDYENLQTSMVALINGNFPKIANDRSLQGHPMWKDFGGGRKKTAKKRRNGRQELIYEKEQFEARILSIKPFHEEKKENGKKKIKWSFNIEIKAGPGTKKNQTYSIKKGSNATKLYIKISRFAMYKLANQVVDYIKAKLNVKIADEFDDISTQFLKINRELRMNKNIDKRLRQKFAMEFNEFIIRSFNVDYKQHQNFVFEFMDAFGVRPKEITPNLVIENFMSESGSNLRDASINEINNFLNGKLKNYINFMDKNNIPKFDF